MNKEFRIPLFRSNGKIGYYQKNRKPITENYVNEVNIQSAYFLGAVCETAYGLMVDAKEALAHTPLYKHALKKNVNKAMGDYMSMQHGFYRLTNFKKDFYIDFLDCYDELAKTLTDRLKRNFIDIFIKFRKEDFGLEKGLMLAALYALEIAVIIHNDYFIRLLPELYSKKEFSYECDAFNGIKEIKRLWSNAVGCLPAKEALDLPHYKRCTNTIEQLYLFCQDRSNARKAVRKSLKLHPEMIDIVKMILNENKNK